MSDEINEFYNQKHISTISQKGYYSEKIAFYKQHLKNIRESKNKLKILDIACNDGELSEIFSNYGDVLGIDINKDAVKKARMRGINCIRTDVGDLPKKYESYFDVVIAGDIIEHVFDTDLFLENILRVLKNDGVMLLTTANVASIGRRIMLLMGKNPFLEYSTRFPNVEINVGHIRYYTVFDMKLQLSSLGFCDIKIFGDRINLTKGICIPQRVAKHLPSISRYMHLYAKKTPKAH
ncbi:class I SAM-dependent methyltransferase [Patescibacteria group bacterium]